MLLRVLAGLLLAIGLSVVPAHALTCGGGALVTSATDCTINDVRFDSFAINQAGLSASLFLSDRSHDHEGNAADLVFQVAHAPSPTTGLADILMTYRVQDELGRLSGVNLFNAGLGVTIQETACRNPFVEGTCVGAGNVLANFTVGGSDNHQQSFGDLQSLIYVKKDLQFDTGGFISEFENSHELQPTPEPSTLLLVGTVLTGVGWASRRRARIAS